MVSAITAVIAAILSLTLGVLIGIFIMGLMTASKINSIYEEVTEWHHHKDTEDLDL